MLRPAERPVTLQHEDIVETLRLESTSSLLRQLGVALDRVDFAATFASTAAA